MIQSQCPPAKKRLGQHFLIDPNIIRKILTAAELQPHDTVLEIGPGAGALTKLLCRAVKQVVAIEIDKGLVSYLRDMLGSEPNLDLREGDALQFPYETLPHGTIVVANLPYQVSSPLLFQLFDARLRLARMVLMLQREVAQRLVAPPGSRQYGTLSVCSQYFSTPHIVFKIPPTCFRPRPEVESAVVRFDLRPNAPLTDAEERTFLRLVRAAFGHRRKTIGNSLRDAAFAPGVSMPVFERVGLDMRCRAETLTVEQFVALAKEFHKVLSTPCSREMS